MRLPLSPIRLSVESEFTVLKRKAQSGLPTQIRIPLGRRVILEAVQEETIRRSGANPLVNLPGRDGVILCENEGD